jgi:hypothetical protein
VVENHQRGGKIPAACVGVGYGHMSVIPRPTPAARVNEPGSGMFINTVIPRLAAEFLRNVKVERSAAAV